MIRRTKFQVLLAVFAATAGLLWLTQVGRALPTRQSRVVRVGVYENPPKLFTAGDGAVSGFWAELIDAVAAAEGWEVVWVHGTWDQGLERLLANHIDIMPDVAWTPARGELYAFSGEPVLVSWSRVYVRPGLRIDTILDLEGKTVGGLAGSVNFDGPEGIRELTAGFDVNSTFVPMNSYSDVFRALADGRLDAGVTNKDFGSLNEALYSVDRTPIIFQPAHIEFAFTRDGQHTPELAAAIDRQVVRWKADPASVYYQSLDRHLGQQTPAILVEAVPGWVTNALAVGGGALLFLLAVGITARVQVRRRTAALRESEARYRLLVEALPIGVAVHQEGKMAFVNPAGARLLGADDPQSLEGQSLADIVHPASLAAAADRLQRTSAGAHGPYPVEERWLRRDGRAVTVEVLAAPFTFHGRPAVQIIAADITERQAVEAKLRRQVSWNETLLATTLDGFILADTDGRIRQVNPAYCALTGYTDEALHGMNIRDLEVRLPPEVIEQRIAQMVTDGRARFETTHRARDGRRIDLDVSITVVQDETAPLVAAFVRDITERRRAGDELRRRAEEIDALNDELRRRVAELTTIYRAAQRLQVLHAPDRLAEQIVATLEAALGYSYCAVMLIDEPTGRMIPFAISDQGRGPAFVDADREYILSRSPRVGVGVTGWVAQTGRAARVADVTRDPRYLAMRADVRSELCVPLRSGPQVMGVINVEATQADAYTEADERLLETIAALISTALQNSRLLESVQRQHQRLRALAGRVEETRETERGRMAREIHDELGQALTALKMDAAWIDRHLPAEAAALREKAVEMSALIDDTLAVIRRLASELRPGPLDDLGLAAALEWLTAQFTRRTGLPVALSLPGDDGPALAADQATALFRIAQELLTNVARHADASRVEVSLSVAESDTTLIVRDDGRGINAEQIAAHDSLGLIGIRERAAQCGGLAVFEGAPGKGTTVTVRLPLEASGQA